MKTLITFILTTGLLFSSLSAHAGDEPSFTLVIKNHEFTPAELTIPAGVKVKLLIHNQDSTPEEFESYELGREKIIPAGQQVVVFVGPVKPGRYPFFGEFHADIAKGVLIAK
jgi:hypothetical protein